MKNRAKCKLCNDIIESFHPGDLVFCSCGEIGLDKGDAMNCMANSWDNFIRIDDNGKEVKITVKDESTTENTQAQSDAGQLPKPFTTKKDIHILVEEMIKNIEKLPTQAMYAPVTHADILSVLFVLSASIKSDLESTEQAS